MDDKDHVFARFKDDKPAAAERRERLTIPGRAGATGSRVVEVVHVRAGASAKERPRRLDAHVRSASWDGGFPVRQKPQLFQPIEPAATEVTQPVTHVMPAWEPASPEPMAAPPDDVAEAPVAVAMPARQPSMHRSARRVADPFDAEDDGANCLRCGYAITPAREKRGLMTCAECG
ncbi:hypothetical protein AAFN86_17535 [Roseomonas sp. CAU 1739]|uniref:hypothetical protein n=1 Tax=Roseomonas sp. CAU 1739 TaxID=3140364 RepID=UPI00325ABCA5